MATKKKSLAKKASPKKAAPRKTVPASEKSPATTARTKASNAVDDQLARYRSMRDFKVTAEPSGTSKSTKTSALPFVIQKHAASHLHYDFRLGWNGVLKSWAVSKGPSYVVKDKRLAVQVEDHPMEYGGFEGVIPKGQYGGGTVMVWDQGTWEPQPGHTDVDEGLRTGSLKFIMHGERMKGKWALIRMKGKYANESKPNWLLIKEHDDFERPETDTAHHRRVHHQRRHRPHHGADRRQRRPRLALQRHRHRQSLATHRQGERRAARQPAPPPQSPQQKRNPLNRPQEPQKKNFPPSSPRS